MKSRRDFLNNLVTVSGLSLLPTSAVLAQVIAEASDRTELSVLTTSQAAFLSALADIIIPLTATPAASEAGVVMFIDVMLSDWYEESDTEQFLSGLQFYITSTTTPLSYDTVAALDKQSFSDSSPDTAATHFYRMFKELVLVGYFTSREGMQESLHKHGPVGEFSFQPSGPPGDPIKY